MRKNIFSSISFSDIHRSDKINVEMYALTARESELGAERIAPLNFNRLL